MTATTLESSMSQSRSVGTAFQSSAEPVIQCSGVNFFFGQGELRKQILFNVELAIQPGEVVLLTGPSGSGKTTLLTLIAG